MFRSATVRDVPDEDSHLPQPRTTEVWRAHPGYVGAFTVDLFLAAGLGFSALTSSATRYGTPAYMYARSTPGGIATWGGLLVAGVVLLVVGAVTVARVYAAVLTGGAVVYLLLALWFGISAWTDIRASWWGTWVFAGIAIWHLTQANEHRRSAQALRDRAVLTRQWAQRNGTDT